MGKNSAPAPDPRMADAALRQIDLAEQQYQDYRNFDAPLVREAAMAALGISRDNATRANALSDYQLESMKFNDNRYRTVGIGFEDRLLEDVNRFDSADYKQGQIAAARADVQESFDNAASQSARGLMRRGVNPASGMALATAGMNDIAKATALATAANKTRMAADQVGLSTKMQMYGGMRGLAGLGATSAQLATSGISAGNQSGAGMSGATGSMVSSNATGFGSAMSGMSAGIQGLGSYSQLGIQAADVNAKNDPLNTVLGAATAYGMKTLMASDRRLKTDIRAVGKLDNGLTVYSYRYKAGGPVMLGVMADEVALLAPQAYAPGAANGYDAVDYSKL